MFQIIVLTLLSLLFPYKTNAFTPVTHTVTKQHPHPKTTLTPNTFHRTHTSFDTSVHLFDAVGSIFKNFGKKASAAHILIKPEQLPADQARAKLVEMKEEINNDPAEFAKFAGEFSDCPSRAKGGDLGDFGPGMMVKEFDKVVFEEDVGVVHGPISTQFGEHLILIKSRN